MNNFKLPGLEPCLCGASISSNNQKPTITRVTPNNIMFECRDSLIYNPCAPCTPCGPDSDGPCAPCNPCSPDETGPCYPCNPCGPDESGPCYPCNPCEPDSTT